MNTKKLLALLAGMAVALLAVIWLVPSVMAQDPKPGTGTVQSKTPTGINQRGKSKTPTGTETLTGTNQRKREPGPGDFMGGFNDHGRGGPDGPPIMDAAEALGMTTDALFTELRTGKTIAAIAKEKNVSLDTIVDAMVAPQEERVNQLVTDGYLAQKDAASVLALHRAQITERLNQTWEPRNGGNGKVNPMDTIAATLGMTRTELFTELQNGKTVADVAKEKGIALDDVVDAAMAPMQERMKTMVESGRLTQAEADSRLQTARENMTERMQQEWTPRGGPDGQRPNDGGRRPGPCMP